MTDQYRVVQERRDALIARRDQMTAEITREIEALDLVLQNLKKEEEAEKAEKRAAEKEVVKSPGPLGVHQLFLNAVAQMEGKFTQRMVAAWVNKNHDLKLTIGQIRRPMEKLAKEGVIAVTLKGSGRRATEYISNVPASAPPFAEPATLLGNGSGHLEDAPAPKGFHVPGGSITNPVSRLPADPKTGARGPHRARPANFQTP